MKRELIRQVTELGNSRRMRRIAVLLWAGILCFDPWTISLLVRTYVRLGMWSDLLVPALTQLGITWVAFRGMQIGLAAPTLEDSALAQFGTSFDRLSERQCDELSARRFRDLLLGRVSKDEREAELRLRAEGDAYRLLRPGLAIAVAAYWAVCLLGPFAPVRGPLAITAIVFTWFAVAVLVLPTMVRMWTQPNEVGDMRIVSPVANQEKVT
jgi:hypothetical protein